MSISPLDEELQDLAEEIVASHKKAVVEWAVAHQELSMIVDIKAFTDIVRSLRDEAQFHFKQLIDVTAVDWPGREGARFDVVYHFLSLKHNQRLRLKLRVDEDELVPSLYPLYSTAIWFEREVWDLYGIPFDGNPDLRRILTDYGFEGHPLRKDFPLTGYTELRYDPESERVVYEPVHLVQDYRDFDFVSPWEAMTDIQLPGDEKAGHKQAFGAGKRTDHQEGT